MTSLHVMRGANLAAITGQILMAARKPARPRPQPSVATAGTADE
jgi:hypothetical protein